MAKKQQREEQDGGMNLFGEGVVYDAEPEQPDDNKFVKIGLFEWLNDLNLDKKYLYNDLTDKDYLPFPIMKGMMQQLDTVLLACELNKMPHISNEMHHDFLFHAVDAIPRRRTKWAKSITLEHVEQVQQYFNCNQTVAERYLKVLTPEEVSNIVKFVNQG